MEKLKEKNLCGGCLFPNHKLKDCTRARVCGKENCQSKHHKLVHGTNVPESINVVRTNVGNENITKIENNMGETEVLAHSVNANKCLLLVQNV